MKTKLNYEVKMERFWGLKETVGSYTSVLEAIRALQIKKQAMKQVDPNQEVAFSIISVKETH